MMPICSATPSCSSHSLVSFHGGLRPFCPFRNDLDYRCITEDRSIFGLPNGTHLQRISFKTQAAKSLYSHVNDWTSAIGEKLERIGSYSISATEEGLADITDLSPESADSLTSAVEPDIVSSGVITPQSSSVVLDVENNSLSSVKTGFENLFDGVRDSLSTSINKGENALQSSLDTITSSTTSITKSANETVDNAFNRIFSAVDQTKGSANNKLTSFSSDLKVAASKAAGFSVDVLRGTIVAVENSVTKGASLIVYSYGSAKEMLPPEIKDALNFSEEKTVQILSPVGAASQQIFTAIAELEKFIGLDPNDPVVPFFVILGTSASLWVFYRVRVYGGYSGDLTPQSTLELLTGREDAVLIDVRPEVLRERDGIPDLRRAARSRYASVTLPEVTGPVRKLLKGGRNVDNSLIAAVIRNLKVVKDRSKVIVMDADGTNSKGIARSLRTLGVKRPYLMAGGFQSWAKQGLRVKELKPETALTILNEEAEAILEELRPSPIQVLGYGAGSAAALYAIIEWETTLQLIAIIGLALSIYGRVSEYASPEDFKRDVGLLLTPVKVGAEAFSWAAGKLETNGIGLPTSPSSSAVQNRVLQAAAKHESQPSDTEGVQNPSSEPANPLNENVDFSEA
ncbi:uncharacterized protein LOC126686640 [Mercurialis annua]|uniref:uncharacterized protein LOC126686640 n=1 Tax=Mercurialis annua TaxID=3986 RepID=UPI00215F9726|nr:uncharacterized protein LOC126686640 [Mercurialis annua]XP_050236736.1 uncharacterized protein LOC126686640 [Mercurialis annua]XP_050236737.1 uncharacterized protein LOC126686640 [Mercurialis annua]XP_050236738.1 uncharacterized protein LOC126686640 [Mercurialis annua]XP_050236739.1 uncharacterized protein LOC126686640 [Mercurialis annua]